MRIAMVSFNYGEYCIRLAQALAAHAHVLLLLSRSHGVPHARLLDGSAQIEFFDKPRLRNVLGQLRLVKHLLSRIKWFAPDVVHLQQGYTWFSLALPFMRHWPLIITVHDPRYHAGETGVDRYVQPLINEGFRRASRLIVHANECGRDLARLLPTTTARIHTVPHILLGDSLLAPDVQEEEGNVLFFGRIWPYKGLDYLIQAEPALTERRPHVKIVIAGTGENFDRYRLMMVHPERFHVDNSLISDVEAAAYFKRASVVVLPYVDASQSGVVPMAYSYSKPVVATTVGGLPEVVEDGVTGYLVPPRDAEALARAVGCLLDDAPLRHEMGDRGRRFILSVCSPQAVAAQTMEVYEHALTYSSDTLRDPQRNVPLKER